MWGYLKYLDYSLGSDDSHHPDEGDLEECRYCLSVQLVPGVDSHRSDCLYIWPSMVTSVSRQKESALGAVNYCVSNWCISKYWISTQEIPMIWKWDGKQKKSYKMIKESLLIIFLCLTHSYPKRKENDRRELRAIVPQLLPNYTTSTLPPANQVCKLG